MIGIEAQDAPQISAKTGLNVDQVLEQIVQRYRHRRGCEAPLQALIFDSFMMLIKVLSYSAESRKERVKKGTPIRMMATGAKAEVVEVGYFGAGQFIPCDETDSRNGRIYYGKS